MSSRLCWLCALILLPSAVFAQQQSLTIQQAVDLARKNADAVKAQGYVAASARLGIDEARAAMLPSISLRASGAYLPNTDQGVTVKQGSLGSISIPGVGSLQFPSQDTTINQYKAQDHGYYQGSAEFSQPLFTWGKIRSAVDLATLQSRLADTDLAKARHDAVRDANRAYYGAVLAGQSKAILAELKDLAASILADRRAAFDQGQVTREQVLAAEADLADVSEKLVEATENEADARESLSILTGSDIATTVLSSDFRESAPVPDETELAAQASNASDAVAEARTRLEQARRKMALEQGSQMLLPDLSIIVDASAAGQTLPWLNGNWTDSWNWNVTVGIGTKINVFDGGASWAKAGEAEKDVAAAAAAVSGEENAAKLDARRASSALRRAQAAASAKQAKEAWAAEALKNAELSAEAQVISRQELNAARIQEATARLDLLLSRYDVEQGIADIERLLGT